VNFQAEALRRRQGDEFANFGDGEVGQPLDKLRALFLVRLARNEPARAAGARREGAESGESGETADGWIDGSGFGWGRRLRRLAEGGFSLVWRGTSGFSLPGSGVDSPVAGLMLGLTLAAFCGRFIVIVNFWVDVQLVT
jgi:hypothetical protein